MDIYLATEDALGQSLGERLVATAGHGLKIAVRMGGKGNTYLSQKLPELIRVSEALPVLLLTDLDRIECPPTLRNQWVGNKRLPEGMLFRVAVREAEAWLLADRDAFSDFTGIPWSKLPADAELLDDPKQTLLNLVRRHARREIRAELLPASSVGSKIGHGYNQTLSAFVSGHWSIDRAAVCSDSLQRAYRRVNELAVSVAGR